MLDVLISIGIMGYININYYFTKVAKTTINSKDMSLVSLKSLESRITKIDNILQKLINYEVEVAEYERRSFVSHYNSIIMKKRNLDEFSKNSNWLNNCIGFSH